MKELNCLYGLSLLLSVDHSYLSEALQKAVELLPPAMQYPEIAAARITIDKTKFSTANYIETNWKQKAAIFCGDDRVGLVEIVYLNEKPDIVEGPFRKEERHLIDTIALALGQVTKRHQTEQKLQETNTRFIKSQMELENKNTALREILSHVDREKQDTALLIQNNINRIVQPMLSKLEIGAGDVQKNYLSILRSALDEITSPFFDKLEQSISRLTPREMEVCSMVKNGLSSKEIAQALNTSEGTVRNQRKKIRKKLGLTSNKTNLTSFLKQI